MIIGKSAVRAGVILLLVALLPTMAKASGVDQLLALVPPDAVSVGVVRVEDVRRSAAAQSILARMRGRDVDAEAQRLLREAGLDPAKDVDAIVVALSPSPQPDRPRLLVAAGGRFDPARLARLIESRGGMRKSAAGSTYYLAPEERGESPAISFASPTIVLAGTEDAVVAAIGSLQRRTNAFAASPLGRQMYRIPVQASGWMLLDVQRAQKVGPFAQSGRSPFGEQTLAAVKNVSTVMLWVTETGKGIEFGSAAVATDAETRKLVEDVLKGFLAALRMAAQEKQPELVKVVRRFEIATDSDTVSLSGSVPAVWIETFVSRLR